MASRIDFEQVKRAALDASATLISAWLSEGKREGAEWVSRNPTRADSRGGSFKVNLHTGFWADFATGDKGGDLISLYAYLHGLGQLDAAKELMQQLGFAAPEDSAAREPAPPVPPPAKKKNPDLEWQAIVPVPDSAPPPPTEHYQWGPPTRSWVYRDASGAVLCIVHRFDTPDGKSFLPVTWCRRGQVSAWRWKALPEPRPLYRLDALAARPDRPVLICEGEKAADAAAELLPEFVAVCSLNGSKSAKKTDWSPLRGRTVVIWPDYDESGRAYAADVVKLLSGIAASVEQVKLPLVGTPGANGTIDPKSREPQTGWDAADASAEGWTAQHLATLIRAGTLFVPLVRIQKGRGAHGALVLPEQLHRPGEHSAVLARESVELNGETGQPWPPICGGWVISNDGIQEPGREPGMAGGLICMRPIWVSACTYQPIGNRVSWGVYIRFFDMGWRQRGHAFPMRRLSEQGGVLGQELLDMGLPVVAGKEKMLCRYLGVQAQAAPHTRATSKLGWMDDDAEGPRVFVMPDQVIGDGEPIIYQPDAPNMEYLAATLHVRGSLDDWRDHIARPCMGNPALMFFLLAGLAPPLMRFTETPSGGFHLAGGSTTGKTTALQVAVTPWGCGADPQSGPQHTAIRRWKATGNALESVAEMHNHMLLALDEINEVDPRELGGIIYQLAGGQSKGRATLHGGLRAPRHWQFLYVSSGERSIRDMLRQVGQTLQGGQQVRLPEIPAEDPRTGRNSIIEGSGDLAPREFAEQLKLACARYYGSAGPTFVAYIIGQVARRGQHAWVGLLRDELRGIEDKLVERLEALGEELSPENRRALRQFALLALAGAHAEQGGIIPWSFEETFEAVETMVLRWVRDQGEERTEVERALTHLRDELIGKSVQIVDWATTREQAPSREILGFSKDEHLMLIPSAFRTLVAEWDSNAVLRELAARGFLKHNKGRLTMRSPSIRILGETRALLYWIDRRFLEGSDVDSTGEPPRAMAQKAIDQDVPF